MYKYNLWIVKYDLIGTFGMQIMIQNTKQIIKEIRNLGLHVSSDLCPNMRAIWQRTSKIWPVIVR